MTQDNAQHDKAELVHLRSYGPADQTAVARLYTDGLFEGQITSNDTGADIENIQEAYFSTPDDHFWVAEHEGKVLGMIGVARDGHTAEIRRLRVDKEWQHTTLGARLVELALNHCKEHGELKVVLDTRFERDYVMELFARFGFHHTRTKNLHGKDILEFYVDLYRPIKRDEHPSHRDTPIHRDSHLHRDVHKHEKP
jgi:GNAT superfamily N-acetyltransferase